jgi:hypothetical protein
MEIFAIGCSASFLTVHRHLCAHASPWLIRLRNGSRRRIRRLILRSRQPAIRQPTGSGSLRQQVIDYGLAC